MKKLLLKDIRSNIKLSKDAYNEAVCIRWKTIDKIYEYILYEILYDYLDTKEFCKDQIYISAFRWGDKNGLLIDVDKKDDNPYHDDILLSRYYLDFNNYRLYNEDKSIPYIKITEQKIKLIKPYLKEIHNLWSMRFNSNLKHKSIF